MGNAERTVRAALAAHRVSAFRINVCLADDATIGKVHARHMRDPSPTDVISFLISSGGRVLEGEVIVSYETACRQAKEYGTSALFELLLYVAHGTLHLLGMDDRTPSERLRMNAAASRIVRKVIMGKIK